MKFKNCLQYDTDGSIEFYNWEQLEIWYRDKIKGTVEKLEFNEAVQEWLIKYVKVKLMS